MAIADEKSKQSIKRSMLVRLISARDITNSLSLISGSDYDVAYPFKPFAVKQNGVAVPGFTWDGATLEVEVSTAPDDDNPVIVETRIFLTDNQAKYLDEDDPTGAVTTPVEWQPRLLEPGTFVVKNFIKDLLEGNLSITASSIRAINSDLYFNDYMTPLDSFAGRDIDVWFGFNDQYQLVYSGVLGDPQYNKRSILFNNKNTLKKLQADAYMGDQAVECLVDENTTSPASVIAPQERDLPIPLVMGSVTPYAVKPLSYDGGGFDVQYGWQPDPPRCMRGHHVRWDQANTQGTAGVNGEFITCRMENLPTVPQFGTVLNLTFSAHAFITIGTKNLTEITGDADKVFIGALVFLNGGEPNGTLYRVVDIDYKNNKWRYDDIAQTVPAQIRRASCFVGYIYDPDSNTYSEVGPHPATTSQTGYTSHVTSGGHDYFIIKGLGGSFYRGPGLQFRYIMATDIFTKTHSDHMQKTVEAAGLTANAASFTQADTDLTALTNFSVPEIDAEEYPSYLDIAQGISKSVFGYISVNDANEVRYKILDALGVPTIVINDTDIVEGSLRPFVEYGDVRTRYRYDSFMKNLGNFNSDLKIADESQLSKRLYDRDKTFDNRGHLLLKADILNDIVPRQFEFARKARRFYKMRLQQTYFDIQIGDEVTIDSSELPDTVDALIVSVGRSILTIDVTAMEVPL